MLKAPNIRYLRGGGGILARSPKPIWLLEVCLQEFHPEGKNPDFLKTFQLFWENGYQAWTATENPKLVTSNDVHNWAKKNHSDSGTFNYVFAETADIFREQ